MSNIISVQVYLWEIFWLISNWKHYFVSPPPPSLLMQERDDLKIICLWLHTAIKSLLTMYIHTTVWAPKDTDKPDILPAYDFSRWKSEFQLSNAEEKSAGNSEQNTHIDHWSQMSKWFHWRKWVYLNLLIGNCFLWKFNWIIIELHLSINTWEWEKISVTVKKGKHCTDTRKLLILFKRPSVIFCKLFSLD